MDTQDHIPCFERRWAQCYRIKRGLTDTALCGGLAKDQVCANVEATHGGVRGTASHDTLSRRQIEIRRRHTTSRCRTAPHRVALRCAATADCDYPLAFNGKRQRYRPAGKRILLTLRRGIMDSSLRCCFVVSAECSIARGLRRYRRIAQAYFEGAWRILERRQQLSFDLLHAATVSLEEHDDAMGAWMK